MRPVPACASLAGVFLLCALLNGDPRLAGAGPPQTFPAPPAKPADQQEDPTEALGANAACYVCHMTFLKEDLARTHLAGKVTCISCHGPSDKHANDENIGATRPDITFKRPRIDASCLKCHTSHDVPAGKVIARFRERKLSPQATPVCTECHGTHKIARAEEKKPGKS